MRNYQEGLDKYIPIHMHSGVIHYIVHHIEPGGFLFLMLAGDIMSAAKRADHVNNSMIPNYILFFQEYLDSDMYGDADIVNAWIARRVICN
jgi:hypothetical protein